MKVEHHVAYNAMPETVRQRLIGYFAGPTPILADRVGGTGGKVFLVLVFLAGFAGVAGFFADELGQAYGFQKPNLAMVYGLGLFFAIGALLAFVRNVWAGKAIPYRQGRYLTALDFVDARLDVFRFRPLSQLAGPIRIVDQYTNGVYTGTSVTLNFQGGGSEVFFVRGKGRAEQAVDALNQGTRAIRAALEAGSMEQLVAHDPFFELRQVSWQLPTPTSPPMTGPVAQKAPFYIQHAWKLGLAAALLLCYPTWLLREKIHDAKLYSRLEQYGERWEVEDYISHGGSRAAEAKSVLLPRIVFDAAVRAGSVKALREFMKEFPAAPQVPEARKLLKALYVESRDKFHAEAADDKQLVAAMDALLEWISTNDQIEVPVKYRAPENALAALDQRLEDPDLVKSLGGRKIEPIAAHFDQEASKNRESSVTNVLQGGISSVFPADVVELKHSGRIAEGLGGQLAAASDVKAPELEVSYVVEPSGAMYTSRTDTTRAFIGIVVTFDVTLRVPGLKEPFRTQFKVEPPATFSVQDQTNAGEVYSVMAEKAFESLREKIIVAFFRPGSEAHKQATAALEAAEAERARNNAEPDPAPVAP
jgi:hypothetical protein